MSATFDSVLARAVEMFDPQPDPYAADPVGWVQHRLDEFLWSKQRDICESVRDHRHTAVHSAHGTGKSYVAGRIAAWWVETHPDPFIVTSAPTAPQVKAILWREINRAHRKGNLSGYITQGEIPEWKLPDGLVGYGRKPADYTDATQAAAAFQGIHALHVLVILDEACGIPDWLWTATESIVTNKRSRILAIGNPDDPSGEFSKACAPGSGWNTIHVSAFDLPAFTGEAVPEYLEDLLTGKEWVEERKRRWGEESPLYISKVLGLFPEVTDETLITPKMVREAVERDLSGLAIKEPGRFGADVARMGKDETAVYRWRAGYVRLAYRGHKQDTMKTTGAFKRLLDDHPYVPMWVDVIGVGAGVFDRLNEQGCLVNPFDAGSRAHRPDRFKNRRAEAWWALRELFEDGGVDIDPDDLDLQAQLVGIKYFHDSSGRTQIESKDDMKKRGLPSPDRADALMMAAVQPPHIGDASVPEESSLTSDLLTRAM